MKKRKDSGFTLIELMIVIAVIGILAIVLVPKVGTVKSQAKETGLDVNVRQVQGYVESKINKWVSKGSTPTTIRTDITTAFTGSNKALSNPFTAITTAPGTGSEPTGKPALYLLDTTYTAWNTADANNASEATTQGTVLVEITGTGDTNADGTIGAGETAVSQITIYAFGNDGEIVSEKTTVITP